MQVDSTLPDLAIDFVDEVLVRALKEQSTEQIVDTLNAAMHAQVDVARQLEILIEAALTALPNDTEDEHSQAMLTGAMGLIRSRRGDTMLRIGSIVRELLDRANRTEASHIWAPADEPLDSSYVEKTVREQQEVGK